MKTILVTGNLGYIGPVLTKYFRRHSVCDKIIGVDRGFFENCITVPEAEMLRHNADVQFYEDVRCLSPELFENVDAVVHLAALSNDPIGKEYESITQAINAEGSISVAKMAKQQGVGNFVFASSCSVYGCAEDRKRNETSSLDPLTAYARSKVETESRLKELADENFIVTCHRFATACGMSPRLRLDLVLNDFLASTVACGEIKILSDGSPWRPLIDVEDMARAMSWSVSRNPDNGGVYCVVNTGSDRWNYQIKDLALAVQRSFPETKVAINEHAEPDKRSYQVDFSLYEKLAPEFQPTVSLEESVKRIYQGLKTIDFEDKHFRESTLIRLQMLARLRKRNIIDQDLMRPNESMT